MNNNPSSPRIIIRQARAHNLQDLDLDLPHDQLIVVTGVSGSGKSSLAFDIICREGQRRYLESFSSRARQLLGKLGQAEAERVDNLRPAIALDQKTTVRTPRSTVGTLSELNAHLRLLLSRAGRTPEGATLSRGELSFNGAGACSGCRGLGVVDAIDQGLLIADPGLTLRQGALVITTDSGYIIYSQVTMDVLDQVCRAHGFNVDIPWRELTDEQRQVVLYGSDRLEIPFGKHTLESRLKWKGITARPRQTGFYGGIVPVMEQILKRDRNKNILRFVRTAPCPACGGTRLNERARSVVFQGMGLADFSALSIDELHRHFAGERKAGTAAQAVGRRLIRVTGLLRELGLGYLQLDRAAPTLAGGEAQRLRLASLVGSGLGGMLYVLDEPSKGLHPRDHGRLLGVLRRLVDQGNTVIVVEHDRQTMLAADWLVDLGPGAGAEGGRLLYSGPPVAMVQGAGEGAGQAGTPTADYLQGRLSAPRPSLRAGAGRRFELGQVPGVSLQRVGIPCGALSVVTGVAGSGKSVLLEELARRAEETDSPFHAVVEVDQSPIGRTPRSNPATYTKLFDVIRGLFAAEPAAREAGLVKGHFSFNNKAGRCPDCEGAGVHRLGMHFLGDVELPCETCRGRRFQPQVLAVRHRGLDVSQVLDLSVAEATEFFAEEPRLARPLGLLRDLGLGYLTLGQPSTTLSGGEAQRIKLASHLGRTRVRDTLYVLDEPTTGLHAADVAVLLQALDGLVRQGGTVVAAENHEFFLEFADEVVELAGPPAPDTLPPEEAAVPPEGLRLRGVGTNNLCGIDVDIPAGAITVVTGVSGSGKSSLALDTLHAEGQSRYAENYSSYIRQQLLGRTAADLDSCQGLTPTVAVGQRAGGVHRRSTVATAAELHPLLRLLYSRLGKGWHAPGQPPASVFSFNNHQGACPGCRGLGRVMRADPDKLVTHPHLSLLAGALDGHKTGRFYGERDGQYTATLRQVGRELGLDFEQPWQDLSPAARRVAMAGAGEREFQVVWRFKRGKNEGEHNFHGRWPGFCSLVEEEYARKQADHRGKDMLPVLSELVCPDCAGRRHGPRVLAVTVGGRDLAALCALSVDQLLEVFRQADPPLDQAPQLVDEVGRVLSTMSELGLGHLSLDRATATLSSGEYRRLQLVRQIGVRLQGLTCVLDEPTLGLHDRDTEALWRVLIRLRDQGNTLVLVEHDPWIIARADHVIDLGPGAGRAGGRVVAQGTPEAIRNCAESVTGQWLERGGSGWPEPEGPSAVGAGLKVQGARAHNLQDLDVEFPRGALTAVVGVSGSGKSSLVFATLAASARAGRPVNCREISGLEGVDEVVDLAAPGDAAGSPLGATGLGPRLRKLMAGTEGARGAGLKASHFSADRKGGRCETCAGTGRRTVALDFLADVSSPCPDCGGKGWQEEVLACRLEGKTWPEILGLSVAEARGFLVDQPAVATRLAVLEEAGLGYLLLGQAASSLSGGERRRLQLACGLLPGTGGTRLYLCDEPSAGLHMADIDRLGTLLRRLADAGHTVVMTEHNRQLVAAADHVVALGPGAGERGGRLLP